MMCDLQTTLDPSVIETLRDHLMPFDHTRPVEQLSAELHQYLNFYQLPIANHKLDLCAGKLRVNNRQIVAMSWQPANAVGSVIVVHGYMDHIGLYGHLIRYLLGRRLRVICFDLPGHGLSCGEPAAITDFSDYVQALMAVVNISQPLSAPLQAIGQSMGGAVLLKQLIDQERHQPYPFVNINLFTPLLQPKGWTTNRWFLPLIKIGCKSVKRRFRANSYDKQFLHFLRYRDPLQPSAIPVSWLCALEQWVREFKHSKGSDLPINLIQGSGDKTLAWQYNIKLFRQKLPNLKVHIIDRANHHLVNEIEPLRREIFAALEL